MSEQLGFEERSNANFKYVNLRLGFIAETSKEELPGYFPAKTKNKSGTEFHFFAKGYKFLTGFIDSLKWHSHTLDDGTELKGWDVLLSTVDANGQSQKFQLYISTKDRPYSRFMSTLCNINFAEPVRFVGFMGKPTEKNRGGKVLLLYQGGEKPVQPKFPEKWLSQMIQKKLKEGVPLSEDELEHCVLLESGKVDGKYPYILQNRDDSWNFTNWENFLLERMEEDVIPEIKVRAEDRGQLDPDSFDPEQLEKQAEEFYEHQQPETEEEYAF